MELVVPRHLLDELARALILEDDEVPQQIEKPPLVEHPFEYDLQLGELRRRRLLARDRPPRLEPLLARPDHSNARLYPVGSDQHRIGRKERRNLRLVGLQLLKRRPNRRILIRRILELDDRERQPVDEDHNIRPPRVLPLRHGELIDRHPVVVLGNFEVDQPDLRPSNRPVLPAELHRNPRDQLPMEGSAAFDKRW